MMTANPIRFNCLRNACLATVGVVCAIGLLISDVVWGAPLPVANFTELKSTTTEQDGRVELKVNFTREFSGKLTFCVDGTAERGADYGLTQECFSQKVATVTGNPTRETIITIDLHDDAQVESVETIRVTLQSGHGFKLGSRHQHTVSVLDNDTNWRVVHIIDGMKFSYGMQIIRDDRNSIATVRSDGGSNLPIGSYPVKLKVDDKSFEAIVGPILVKANQTLLKTELARSFTLIADISKQGHAIDYERLVTGSVVESWFAVEGTSYLTHRKPIIGTFLMTRTAGDVIPRATREERSFSKTHLKKKKQKTRSKCNDGDKPKASNLIVQAGSPSPLPAGFGQPYAWHTPYLGFVDEVVSQAREKLYSDKAPTKEARDVAAFRYKALLYSKEEIGGETHIRAQFAKIGDYWDCAAKVRAWQVLSDLMHALRHAPWSRKLRWAVLDTFYDIAAADKALAQEKHVALAKLAIEERVPGTFVINEEIALLEELLPLYRNAFEDYMALFHHSFGIDMAALDVNPKHVNSTFGYYFFSREVPHRSPYANLLKDGDGNWVLPTEAVVGNEQPRLFKGYKDVTLLFELLRACQRAAHQLSKRYLMRGEPPDLQRAKKLISKVLLASYMEGHALLHMFPEVERNDNGLDAKSGLKEAISGWRSSYSALGQIYSFLKGKANPLGFTDDFLALFQSVIPGNPSKYYFHSYDVLVRHIKSDVGPLTRALNDFKQAHRDYANYRGRLDQLAQQFTDRAEFYDSRLRTIVGANPGNPQFNNPTKNQEGLIGLQLMKIERARLRLNTVRQKIKDLHAEIRNEIERRGEVAKINDAIRKVYLDFGGVSEEELKGQPRQIELSKNLTKISVYQTAANNIAAAASGISFSADFKPFGVGFGVYTNLGAWAYALNAAFQSSMEEWKVRLQVAKERLAILERAKVHSLHADLMDATSRKLIKSMLLRINSLNISISEAALELQEETARLAALYLEKEDLERRKAESNKVLSQRYIADPSLRILKNASLLRSESSFETAQRWMFMTIRAAEYKWNQTFEHTVGGVSYSMQSLHKTRNARELDELLQALVDWNKKFFMGTRSGKGYKKLSFRKDFLGFKKGGTYFHRKTGKRMSPVQAFRSYIEQSDNFLNPEEPGNPLGDFKVLKLGFSTAKTPETGGLFLRSRALEKVNFLRVKLSGANVTGGNIMVDGHLKYGGVSLIRSRGTRNSRSPNRLGSDTTAYVIRQWFFDRGRWHSKNIGMDINLYISSHPDVPPENYIIKGFRELSVAASEWTLYIAVESKNGVKLLDLSGLNDIEFHIDYFWSDRT